MRSYLALAAIVVLGLCGCAVVDAGTAVVGAGVDVAGTAASVAGDIVTAPLGGDDSNDHKK